MDLQVNPSEILKGRSILVTGHTGFVGAWLCLALLEIGARPHGLSRRPGGLLGCMGLDAIIPATWGCVTSPSTWAEALTRCEPEVVAHLAAVASPNDSPLAPRRCFEVHVMGTVNLLEACAKSPSVRGLVLAGSENCYRDVGVLDESAPLGGVTPYAASKSAMEFLAGAVRPRLEPRICLASLRLSNCIGGGDASGSRVAPECLRAFAAKEPAVLRTPHHRLSWLHVLDAVRAYLLLTAGLLRAPLECAGPMNIGPGPSGVREVGELAAALAEAWGGGRVAWPEAAPPGPPPKIMDTSRAKRLIGWQPRLDFAGAVRETAEWGRRVLAGERVMDVSLEQIRRIVLDAGAFRED